MKLLATASSFAILCVLLSSVALGSAHSHLTKRFISVASLSLEDIIDCTNNILDYQCDPEYGYVHELIDIALGCGNASAASEWAAKCATSESGYRCGVSGLYFDVEEAEVCSNALTTNSCTPDCSTFLQKVRDHHGCCINTYLNRTDSEIYSSVAPFLDYHLWYMCHVDLPAPACDDVMQLDPPSNAETCTDEEFYNRYVEYECMPSVGQPLVDKILQYEKCYPFARQQIEGCGHNPYQERYCASLLDDDILGSLDTDNTLVSLAGCSGSTCNSECKYYVKEAYDRFGCCVNIYNTSDPDIHLSAALSYEYWVSACGVNAPGECVSSLRAGATAMKALSWLTVAIMAFACILG